MELSQPPVFLCKLYGLIRLVRINDELDNATG
jgi:hypothetical protein